MHIFRNLRGADRYTLVFKFQTVAEFPLAFPAFVVGAIFRVWQLFEVPGLCGPYASVQRHIMGDLLLSRRVP